LPPKQALTLALAERARRTRDSRTLRPRRRLSDEEIQSLERPPEALTNATSLVLDRNHPLSDLVFRGKYCLPGGNATPVRYKVYWGGRGSAKSWGIAEALIRIAKDKPIRVLCLREFQNSIKESSHKMLVTTIERLGLQAWFNVTKDGITSRAGAEFIFKGCHNNLNSLRSMVEIDICWLEEAHSISEASWRVLIPTIREEGSEIWVSFNMDDENDATYRRLVAVKRHDSIVHKVNYDSNPYFPKVLRDEMEFDKESDFHLYEHIWLGMPRQVSNAIILNGKYVQREVDPMGFMEYGQDNILRLGMDFGHGVDPNALLRMYIRRHKELIQGAMMPVKSLHITHEAYGHADLNDDMVQFVDSVPGTREWPIWCDSARPETISWLCGQQFAAKPVEKWDGSVKDGIAHLRGYYEIVIDPQCTNTLREAYAWRYKVDPKNVDEHGQPQVLPIVVDKHNHTWDAGRYGLNGEILRGGAMGVWHKLAENPAEAASANATPPVSTAELYARLAAGANQ
jgi:phage terminase large subunit